MSSVILSTDFSIENVSFSQPRKNNMGGISILLNYMNNGKSGPLIMQTPKMRIPFGVDVQEYEGGAPKYSINASLATDDSPNTNLKLFTDNIRSLDDFTKARAVECSDEWFGKKKTAEVVEELFKSAEKKPKTDKYASTLKLKLPTRDNKPQFEVFDETKNAVQIVVNNEIDLSSIEKGSEVVAIIQCTGIWFVGKTSFGIGWKIIQLKTYKNAKLVGYSIVDDDPDEEEIEEVEEEEEEEEEEIVEAE